MSAAIATCSQRQTFRISAAAAAELVFVEMYEKVLAALPSVNAKVVKVQEWILKWFAIDDTYLNDIAVPKFVSQLTISGTQLWSLSDEAILQYLVIQNVLVCAGSGGQMYEKDVITNLAADIAKAKRRAITGWIGSCSPPEKGKLKRMEEEYKECEKRPKLMNTSADELTIAEGTKAKTTTSELPGGSDIIQNLYQAMENQLPEIDMTALFEASSSKPDPAANNFKEARRQFIVTNIGDLVEVEDDQEDGDGQPGGNMVSFVANNTNNTTQQNGSHEGTQSAQPFQTLTLPRLIDEDPDEYGDVKDVVDLPSGSEEESDECGN